MSISSYSLEDSCSTNSLSSPESAAWSSCNDDAAFLQRISPTLPVIKASLPTRLKSGGSDNSSKKERRRTQNINSAFADLRGCIPNVPTDTKLSKIKTLRLAISYIQHLMQQLNDERYNMVVGTNTQINTFASFCQYQARVGEAEKVLPARRSLKRSSAERVSFFRRHFLI